MQNETVGLQTRAKSKRKGLPREHQRTMAFEPILPEVERSSANSFELKKKPSYFQWKGSEVKEMTSSEPTEADLEVLECSRSSHQRCSEEDRKPSPSPQSTSSTIRFFPLIQNPEHYTFPTKKRVSTRSTYSQSPSPRRHKEMSAVKRLQESGESRIAGFRRRASYGGSENSEFRRRQDFDDSRNYERQNSSESLRSVHGKRRNSNYENSENRKSPNLRTRSSPDFRRGQRKFGIQECEKAENRRILSSRTSNYGIFSQTENQLLAAFTDYSIPSTSTAHEYGPNTKFDNQKQLINTIMSSSTNELLIAGYSQRDAMRLEKCQRDVEAAKMQLEERSYRQESRSLNQNRHRQDFRLLHDSDSELRQNLIPVDRRQNLESQGSEFRSRRYSEPERRQDVESDERPETQASEFGRRQRHEEFHVPNSGRLLDSESRRRCQWESNSRRLSHESHDSEMGMRQDSESIERRRRRQWDSDERRQYEESLMSPPRRRQDSEFQRRHSVESTESIGSRRRHQEDPVFCRAPESSGSRWTRSPESSGDSDDIQILKVIQPISRESSTKRRLQCAEENEEAELVKKKKSKKVTRPGPFYNTDQRLFEEAYDKTVKEEAERRKRNSEREGMHAISSLSRENIRRHLGRLQNVTHCKLRVSSHRQLACYYNVEIYDADEPADVKKAGEILDVFSFELIRNRRDAGRDGIESFIYNVPAGVRRYLMSPRYKERREQIKHSTGVSAIIDLQLGCRHAQHQNLPLHFEGRADPLHEAKLAFDRLCVEIQTILSAPIVEVQLSEDVVNLILKNEGEGIKRVQAASKTWIQLEKIESGRSRERFWKASIQGAAGDVEVAKTMLARELRVSTWCIPRRFCSRLVGKKGANIAKIRNASGATCHLVDADEDGYSNLEIRGREKEVMVAERMTGECMARFEAEDEKAAKK